MGKSNKGFTLIELIIVIAILGIVALIAIPNLAGIRQRAQINADIRTAEQLGKAIRIWETDRDASAERILPSLKNSDTNIDNIIVELNENNVTVGGNAGLFKDLTDYIALPDAPKSWQGGGNGAYYVSTTGDNRIVVGISKAGETISNLTATLEDHPTSLIEGSANSRQITEVYYDGVRAGWCYLEK